MSAPGWIRQALAVASKDLVVEWRAPARVSGVFCYALALLVIIAFAAGPDTVVLRHQAGGYLWLGLLLASTRSLDQSLSVELENGSLEGLVAMVRGELPRPLAEQLLRLGRDQLLEIAARDEDDRAGEVLRALQESLSRGA